MHEQEKLLFEILRENEPLHALLCRARECALSSYYFGAGCITQTVWNHFAGNDLMWGITDIDLVYYDASDLSYEAEDRTIQALRAFLSDVCPPGIPLDIKNQARVHLWYPQRFGVDMSPYHSVEEAIDSWPTMASAIGVRYDADRPLVYAPFGLDDLMRGIIRPNKRLATEEAYYAKARKWQAKWPDLRIEPW